ncbi:hypothetical protein BpHYR1_005172 [Brachionus plicatilis]|uniref:Uncharacterized protein n=1 Tax=Brachionus plicatilis TaxID=10195 RepID=A0A3M7RJA4_BRAPC|nr:hypothetical protein BpHYR1_005172 [Brachionus plicatilis]
MKIENFEHNDKNNFLEKYGLFMLQHSFLSRHLNFGFKIFKLDNVPMALLTHNVSIKLEY